MKLSYLSDTRTQSFRALFGVFLLTLTGCTQTSKPQLDAALFEFVPDQVTELTLAKADPESGDRWLTTLTQTKKRMGSQWKFTSSTNTLGDSAADDLFLSHLVDALQTLKTSGPAPRGPLESFLLNPPRYALRWKTPQQEYELRVGAKLKDKSIYYITTDNKEVLIAEGSALQLLDRITSFEALRKRTWTEINPDDINEIETLRGKNSIFYTQRDGDIWTDRKHRSMTMSMPTDLKKRHPKLNIDTFLNELVSAQAEDWIDHPEKAKQILGTLEKTPHFEIWLKDLHQQKTTLKVAEVEGVIYGTNTSRPGALFVLPREILGQIKAL